MAARSADANRVDRWVDTLTTRFVAIPPWLFTLVVFLATTGWCGWLAHDLFHAIPRLDDSVASVYQARVFAEGALRWPVDATLKPWFEMFGVVTPPDGPNEWTSMYPPGMAILFLPGVLTGLTWLMVPLCGGLLAVSIVALARELFDETTARVAGITAVFSPYLTVVSATHLSHTPAALLVTLGWLCTLKLVNGGHWRWAIGAGASVGVCILFRPETALLVGGVIAVGVLIQWRRALPRWPAFVAAAAVAGCGVLLLTLWQGWAFGEAGLSGHEVQMGDGSKFGVDLQVNKNYYFHHVDAINHAIGRARAVLTPLLGWPIPAEIVLLAPIFMLAAFWRSVWLVLPAVALSVLFYYYWYWEEWLPGRYLFPAVPMLLVLAAWSAVSAGRAFAMLPLGRTVSVIALIVACGWSFAVASPRYHQFFGPHHADVEDWLPEIMAANAIDNALVLVVREGTLHGATYNDYYTAGFRLNALNLDGPIVYSRDGNDRDLQLDNAVLFSHFAGRKIYRYTYNQRNRRARLEQLTVENGQVVGEKTVPWAMIESGKHLGTQ